ncbi:MAG: polyprenyl synthetase family protein [Paracoccaceae bacterium]|nr:polyprenyl synthetase family protein [Paracoccaceae bacterium]
MLDKTNTTSQRDTLIVPEILREDLAKVETIIRERSDSELVERINQVLLHIFGSGGKRFRPLLTLSAARLLGYKGDHHLNLAAAVEFVHTATLVHDDVVDQSKQRRGKPAANYLWDDKTSILVGDYLFARSFQLMVSANSLRSLAVLSDASATIAEAEVLQLVNQNNSSISVDTYLTIIKGKTAALFSAATAVGGIVGRGTDQEIRGLTEFGNYLGIGFQIMDDLLDYEGHSPELGKNVGDDFKEGKVTLPVIRAIEQADEKETAFWKRVFEDNNIMDGDLERALMILKTRGIIEEVRSQAFSWSEKAKNCLEKLPNNHIASFLGNLADNSVARKS